jgi:hypothetical protein
VWAGRNIKNLNESYYILILWLWNVIWIYVLWTCNLVKPFSHIYIQIFSFFVGIVGFGVIPNFPSPYPKMLLNHRIRNHRWCHCQNQINYLNIIAATSQQHTLLTFLQLLRTYRLRNRKEVSNNKDHKGTNIMDWWINIEYGLIMCLKQIRLQWNIFKKSDSPTVLQTDRNGRFIHLSSQMTQMSIGIKWVLTHRPNHLVFIFILVVVDPSPASSTCRRKGQLSCPSHSKVTEIIT